MTTKSKVEYNENQSFLSKVYVDASQACNDLSFLLGNNAVDTALAQRSWSIRISQYECGYENLAPPGCTQYFYGNSNGIVNSYNYQGNYHLADQNQVACIRREKGNCRICYSTVDYTDLMISGNQNLADRITHNNFELW